MPGNDTRPGGGNDLQQFVQKAAIANMAEIQLGQLAAQHAENPQVKQFAQMMVDDHTRALEQLRNVASGQGIQVPSELDGKHQKLQQKLSKLQGAEFDRAYMDAMVDTHKDTEKLLKSHAGKGASASASNMGSHHGTSAGTSSSGTAGTTGSGSGSSATGTSGTSGTGSSATAGTTGSTSGSTETGTSSVGTPGTAASSGTSGSSSGSSMGSTSSMGAGSTPASADEWASMTLPKVRAHLDQARTLEDQVKQSGRSNTGGNNNQGASTGGTRSGDHAGGSGASQSGSGTSGSGTSGSGSTGSGSTPPQQ